MRKFMSAALAALFLLGCPIAAVASDRVIIYSGENPSSQKTNQASRNTRVAMGTWMRDTLGANSSVFGNLTIQPYSGMNVVTVPTTSGTPVSLYQLRADDTAPMGSNDTTQLPADSTQIVVQGLQTSTSSIIGPLAAPTSSGLTMPYLLEAQVQTLDRNPQPITFIAANGQKTVTTANRDRSDIIVYQLKPGTQAASPVIPTADTGWVGVGKVLVPYGATSITSAMITTYPSFAGYLLNGSSPTLAGLTMSGFGSGCLQTDASGHVSSQLCTAGLGSVVGNSPVSATTSSGVATISCASCAKVSDPAADLTSACVGTSTAGLLLKRQNCFDVTLYGAKGDGTTDDTTAIQNAMNAATAGGIVYLPAGSYKLSTALVPKDGTVIQGAGWTATTLIAPAGVQNGAGAAINIAQASGSFYNGLTVRDLAIDGTNQYRTGGPNVASFVYPSGANLQGINNLIAENIRVLSPAGFGLTICGGGVGTKTKNVRVNNIYIENEWNGNDSIGGGACDGGSISNVYVVNPAGTGIDLVWVNDLQYRSIKVVGGAGRTNGTVGVMSDSGSSRVSYDGLFIDSCTNGVIVESAAGTGASTAAATQVIIRNFAITNSQKSGIFFNTATGTSKYPQNVVISDGYIDGINLYGGGSVYGINFSGGDRIDIHDVTFGPNMNGAYALAFITDANSRTVSNVELHHVDMRAGGTSWLASGLDFTTARVHNDPGLNPFKGTQPDGSSAPAVPASGSAFTNNYGVRAVVYVSGGTMTSQTLVGGSGVGISTGSFIVDPGSTITLFYSAAPTWKWIFE